MLPADQVSATGYSSFWGGQNVYQLLHNRSPLNSGISRMLSRRGQMRALKEAMLTLNGAAAGSAAAASYKRVQHSSDPGGARTVETVTVINRNTVTSDKDYIDAILNEDHIPNDGPTAYPADLSGNGGGGKVGF